MLITTYKPNERSIIDAYDASGNPVVIAVMNVGKYPIRIGIDAPKDIPVNREAVRKKKVKDGTIGAGK